MRSGVTAFLVAETLLESGDTPAAEKLYPKKSRFGLLNAHLDWLSVTPFSLRR